MMMRVLPVVVLLPLVAGFTVQRPAMLHPPRSSSLLILNEIDIDSVTSAVTLPGEKGTEKKQPASSPAPAVAPPPKAELPSDAVSASPAESAPAPPKAAPAARAPPTAIDTADLPLPAIGGAVLAAFAVGTFAMRGGKDEREEAQSASPAAVVSPAAADASSDDDVSIPYDSAARLAYDTWRAKFNKGDFEAGKYKKFQVNYEKMAVANVVAKKKAREDGTTATGEELGDMADQ